MQLAVRPYITTGIVIAGASALVAAPLGIPPSVLTAPSVAITPTASALDGAIHDFDSYFTTGGQTAEVLLSDTGALPGELSRAFLAAANDPHLLPSLGSAFLYGFLSPTPGSTVADLAHLATQLPAPFGPSSHDIGLLLRAFQALGSITAHTLPALPSPEAGADAIEATHLPHVVEVATDDLEIAGEKFGEVTAFTAAWAGDLPNNVVHFLHAAAADPHNLPTLMTNFGLSEMTDLGEAVFGPMVCLLQETLPPKLADQFTDVVHKVLAVLPQPEATTELQVTNDDTTQESLVQKKQSPSPAAGLPNLLNPTISVNHKSPDLTESNNGDEVDARKGPRLNVVKINPLAILDHRATVGDNVSAGSAPRPGQALSQVVNKVVQAPSAIARQIHDALKPHKSEPQTAKDPAPSDNNPD